MKFLRKTYWYASAYLQKHGLLILGTIVFGVILFSVLLRTFASVIQLKETRYIGRINTITLATLPKDIQTKISEGLTDVDQTGNAVPGLAERWTQEDDGKTYRFVLKKGMKWQDGKEITPQDVVYNFSDVQVITTQNEVVFKLKDAFAPFPIVVSQPLFREEKKRKWFFFSESSVIGTGKYHVSKITEENGKISQLELESDEERLVYRFYPTEARALLAYKRGEVDTLERISDGAAFNGWKRTTITPTLQQDEYVAIFFNTSMDIFDKQVRQALNYAIPKVDGEERALTPLSPHSWAYNKTVKEYLLDHERAITLLLRAVPKQRMEFELATVPIFQKEAETVKGLWEQLGKDAASACRQSKEVENKEDCGNLEMSVQLRVTNVPSLSNFQTLLIAQQSPVDPDQYYLWHSTQQTNFTSYRSPHIDKLLEDGRKIINQQERKTIYQDFQQYLIEDSPAIFLHHVTWYTIERI